MKVYDDLYVDDYSGMLVYKGHEFVREDIEQMFSVLAQKTSLNVMRLQQSKWDWWYDSERNVITLQEVIDDNEAEKIEICYDDNMLHIMNFMDIHPDVIVASYTDFK
jgi:hypothetical protein